MVGSVTTRSQIVKVLVEVRPEILWRARSAAVRLAAVRELVTEAMALLRANYVFPDAAELAATEILAELDAGVYDGLNEPELAARLTDRLYRLCGDWHLRVRVRDDPRHA